MGGDRGNSSRQWGDGPAREGRPGPPGAKYTQQAAPGYHHHSPFEQSPHQQTRSKLPVNPALTAAAASATTPVVAVAAGAEPGQVAATRGADEAQGSGIQAADTRDGHVLIRATEGGDIAPVPPTPQSMGLVGAGRETGAEAGAGSTASAATETSGCDAVDAGGFPVQRNGRDGNRGKKAGLWELKAERSRLELAVAEAERDRDVDKAIAKDAACRLQEALARLESLRRGVRNGGVGIAA